MSDALYRKYRPQKFSDVIGQQHIVRTLLNAIKNGRVGHAYLFTGPRGTGKTTLARIFAKTINCEKMENGEPCLKCRNCQDIQNGKSLDIIEIDAASHTGVENIRELKETIVLRPAKLQYKVYIIDEVHMLSLGAFNALLKTLEEPPSHAIFILATTAAHKIPDTILSRCQRFDLARLPSENIIRKLSSIAKSEGVKIDQEALQTIAIAAEGGMRDAESLLSQIMALEDNTITLREVEEILGAADRRAAEELAEFILQKNISPALVLVNKLSENGYNLEILAKTLLNYLRQLLIISINPELSESFSFELTPEQTKKLKKLSEKTQTKDILILIEKLFECQGKIKSSFMPQLPLELAIIQSAQSPAIQESSKTDEQKQPDVQNIHLSQPLAEKDAAKKEHIPIKKISEKNISSKIKIAPAREKADKSFSLEDAMNNWNKFLEAIKPYNHSLNALLSNCQPVKVEGNVITIAAKYSFHKNKINEMESRLTIEKILGDILKSTIKVFAISEEEAGVEINIGTQSKNSKNTSGTQNSLLNDALNILGGKIVE